MSGSCVAAQKNGLERALALKEKHYGPNHLEVALALMNLSNAYCELGNFKLQRKVLERALSIQEQVYGWDHREVATTLNHLG